MCEHGLTASAERAFRRDTQHCRNNSGQGYNTTARTEPSQLPASLSCERSRAYGESPSEDMPCQTSPQNETPADQGTAHHRQNVREIGALLARHGTFCGFRYILVCQIVHRGIPHRLLPQEKGGTNKTPFFPIPSNGPMEAFGAMSRSKEVHLLVRLGIQEAWGYPSSPFSAEEAQPYHW